MQEFKIGANEAGQRFDKFLHKYLKEAGTGFLYKMLRKKNITLNKKKADGKEILSVGDEVQFFFSDETFAKFRGNVVLKELDKNINGDIRNSKMKVKDFGNNAAAKDNVNYKKNSEVGYGVKKNNIARQYELAYEKLKGI